MKIRPSLFVGIGSTGVDIVNAFRDLCYTEFGKCGLPIFRFLSIETNSGHSEKSKIGDRHSLCDYEKHDIIHTKSLVRECVRERITREYINFDQKLHGWLSEPVLDTSCLDGSVPMTGAGHIRQIGRLAFWMEHKTILRKLMQAHNTICEGKNWEEAEKFLREHFGIETFEIDTDTKNVFVVGTIVGGTGSGMATDVAYTIRKFGSSKLYGLLTMPHRSAANQAPGESQEILLANSYAFLLEEDYFSTPESSYPASPASPDQEESPDSPRPFDIVTYYDPHKDTRNGIYDYGQLSNRVAKDLFARAIGGIDKLLDADLDNAVSRSGNKFGQLRPGSEKFLQKNFATGLAMIWVPKYWVCRTTAIEIVKKVLQRQSEAEEKPSDAVVTAAENCATGLVEDIGKNIRRSVEAHLKEFEKELNEMLVDPEGYLKKFEGSELVYLFAARKLLEGLEIELDRIFPESKAKTMEWIKKEGNDFGPSKHLQFLSCVKSELENNNGKTENPQSAGETAAKQISDAAKGKWRTPNKRRSLFCREVESKFKERKDKEEKDGLITDSLISEAVARALEEVADQLQEARRNTEKEAQENAGKRETLLQKLKDYNAPDSDLLADDMTVETAKKGVQLLVDELDEVVNEIENEIESWFNGEKNVDDVVQKAHEHVAARFKQKISGFLRGENFTKKHIEESAPSQTFCELYENKRIDFGQGAFNYVVSATRWNSEESSLIQSDRESKQVDWKHSTLSSIKILYRSDLGWTVPDLEVSEAMENAYETYQKRFGEHSPFPLHTHKDPNYFSISKLEAEKQRKARERQVADDFRALRDLLPKMPEAVRKDFFPHIEFSSADDFFTEVVGDVGFKRKFVFSNEEDLRNLTASLKACEAFLWQTLEGFMKYLKMYETWLMCSIKGVCQSKSEDSDRRETEDFYTNRVKIWKESLESWQESQDTDE